MPARPDRHSISLETFEKFSDVTLELQRLAREITMSNFHRQALLQLRRLLDFDQAWWGRASVVDNMPLEHCTYLLGLTHDYLADWQSVRQDDITIGLVHAEPGRSAIVDSRAASTPSGLRWLGVRHGFRELLCIIHIDTQTQLSVHLSLYRQPEAPPFSEKDRQLLNLLMPHLVAAESANQIRTLVSQRASMSQPNSLALAVCDRQGMLHCAESGFVELLLKEWPDWSGPLLPPSCIQGHDGRRIMLTSAAVRDLYLLTAFPRSALSMLSARETDVAQRFGEGQTYKEIARTLGLAPNTVRHHIRSIYSKLGVSDKTQITGLLRPPP